MQEYDVIADNKTLILEHLIYIYSQVSSSKGYNSIPKMGVYDYIWWYIITGMKGNRVVNHFLCQLLDWIYFLELLNNFPDIMILVAYWGTKSGRLHCPLLWSLTST